MELTESGMKLREKWNEKTEKEEEHKQGRWRYF